MSLPKKLLSRAEIRAMKDEADTICDRALRGDVAARIVVTEVRR